MVVGEVKLGLKIVWREEGRRGVMRVGCIVALRWLLCGWEGMVEKVGKVW